MLGSDELESDRGWIESRSEYMTQRRPPTIGSTSNPFWLKSWASYPRLQAAVMLCDLEGSSLEEAARRLGWPVGTVKSRLSRARARLRTCLTRRGLAPTDLSIRVPLLAVALPQSLVEATARSAQSLIAGRLTTAGVVSASVTKLTEGVLRTMFLTKLKLIALGLLAIISGSAVLLSQATAQKPVTTTEVRDNRATPAKTANDDATRDAETDLIMLERAWADAIPRRDAAIVKRILSEDFAGIDPFRAPYTKATYIRDLENGIFPTEPIEIDQVKPRVFGETGVVTSRFKVKVVKSVVAVRQLTNVYVKQQGRWQCVASHGCWNPGIIDETKNGGGAVTARSQHTVLLQDAGLFLKAKATPRADQTTKIRPRFDCLLEKVYVKAGQTVKKGDPLADLFSADLAAAKNDYRSKQVRSQNERRLLQMRQKLAESNAISQQLLVDTENDESRSRLEFQTAREKLKILGLDDETIGRVEKEEGEQKARLILRAPIGGTVIEVGAEPGNLYDTKDSLMTIESTSHEASAVPQPRLR